MIKQFQYISCFWQTNSCICPIFPILGIQYIENGLNEKSDYQISPTNLVSTHLFTLTDIKYTLQFQDKL